MSDQLLEFGPEDNLQYIQEHKSLFDLSDAECVMVAAINAGYLTTPESGTTEKKQQLLERLKGDLQGAVEVELATIPLYLYTYYSINRTKKTAKDLDAQQIYMNQAGGVIMSVAVEEMLHMSLSSNIYYALYGTPPALYHHAPASYPATLPNHTPNVPPGPGIPNVPAAEIPLGTFSYEQLWKFLLIEYAHNPTEGDVEDLEAAIIEVTLEPDTAIKRFLPLAGWPSDQNWHSIGQYYSFIRCIIASRFFDDGDFNAPDYQLQSYNYSPNNVDTIYPARVYQKSEVPGQPDSAASVAVYANEPDSAVEVDASGGLKQSSGSPQSELATINSREDVMAALETICEQGEGYSKAGQEERLIDDPETDHADPQHYERELSHFAKFLMLQMQLKEFTLTDKDSPSFEELPSWMKGEITGMALLEAVCHTYRSQSVAELTDAGYLYNFPTNPTSATYEGDPLAKAYNDFLSGLFQYMLLMTEAAYLIEPGYFNPKSQSTATEATGVPSQMYFFNVALHRSMIWVMDKCIGTMRSTNRKTGDTSQVIAPTFDNTALSSDKTKAYGELCALGNALSDAMASAGISRPGWLDLAVPPKGTANSSMQLPDVSKCFAAQPDCSLAAMFGTVNT